jgi:hypothetical protein
MVVHQLQPYNVVGSQYSSNDPARSARQNTDSNAKMTGRPFLEQPALHSHPKAAHRAALLSQASNLQQVLREASTDPAKTLWGVGQGISSAKVTRSLVQARPDFIWFDLEHGFWSSQGCPMRYRWLTTTPRARPWPLSAYRRKTKR